MKLINLIKENAKKVKAAGILCVSEDTKNFLVVKRAEGSPEPNTWCSAGGKVEESDKNWKDTALREFKEETGFKGNMKVKEVYIYNKPELEFHNFIGVVPKEFIPKLDKSENTEYKWLSKKELLELPDKHFGLQELLNNLFKK